MCAPSITPIERERKMVDNESQPWSKSSPSGFATPMFRACFPSMESRVLSQLKKTSIKIDVYLVDEQRNPAVDVGTK